ncbi:MAG: fumarylacetoacetate hydrolase family protein [Candidatus Bathyarchaeia archaeon]|jgi:2-keto-4-pentenoate hydratase/2-oxohepta-3-ene-1,7-dioic acid hydratase in catechol pathway
MKLVTFRFGKSVSIGVVLDENVLDLNSSFKAHLGGSFKGVKVAPLDMLGFLDLGSKGLAEAKKAVKVAEDSKHMIPLKKVKLLAPIPKPRKNIVCLGLNYAEHVKEGNKGGTTPNLPPVPIYFTKPPTAVTGPYDNIIYPKVTEKLDYEAELAFVIGKNGKNIPEERVYDYIVGYMAFNDVSARDLQSRHQQWYRGKSIDTFAPMGPWIVTKDDVGDPQDLDLWCKVNSEERQHTNTSDMIFSIKKIVATLSSGITLEVGDIFATGTPSGVGMAHPLGLLKPGDVVEVGIEKIGTIKNKVVAEK